VERLIAHGSIGHELAVSIAGGQGPAMHRGRAWPSVPPADNIGQEVAVTPAGEQADPTLDVARGETNGH
jgi:hypothetical protein